MKEYTIKELLEAKEGEHYQFKEAKTRFDSNEAAECCCALSNCGGGLLVFGISDKRPRKVAGSQAFDQPERTRKGLIDKLKVMVDFQILHDPDGKRVLVFDVAPRPIGSPVQVDGIAWWYEADSLIPMPESIRYRIYQESGFDFSGSICRGATLDDLDDEAVQNFRSRWFQKTGNDRLLTLTKEQLLRDCGAVTDEGITYAALILFGKHSPLDKFLPQSEVVFEYRDSNASGPAAQREEFRVGFFAFYDRLWDLVNLRNTKQHYQEGLFIYDIPTFNERVTREALLNAVSHRDYQSSGSVFVRQYPDRLVLESPGGFPIGITLDNILDRQKPRNRRIAEILALCGVVERSGQGMNLMYELSIRESKQLPDFTGTDDYFVNVTLNGIVMDADMLTVISKIGEDRLKNLTTNDFIVINELYHQRPVSFAHKSALKKLCDLGIIEHVGRSKYVIARGLYVAAGKSGVHTRLVGLDTETNKTLIMTHMSKNNDKGTQISELLQVLPNLSREQVKGLVRKLQKEDKIFYKGKGPAAKWYIKRNEDF